MGKPGRSKASWRCGRAGLRCFAVISARTSATASASSADGISPAISPGATRRDTYWFVGRADDVIKTSGHLIGPFEVESTLMEHPAVAEVGRDRQFRIRWRENW